MIVDCDIETGLAKSIENFIYGDIHWNKNGTKLVFEFLVDNIKF